jgi:hypothetical protein
MTIVCLHSFEQAHVTVFKSVFIRITAAFCYVFSFGANGKINTQLIVSFSKFVVGHALLNVPTWFGRNFFSSLLITIAVLWW